jgi:PRTRC genetic system protein B
MNIADIPINKSAITPDLALVLYNNGAISRHTIHGRDNNFQMGSGHVLSKQGLTRLLNAKRKAVEENLPLEILPTRLVLKTSKIMVWIKDPCQHDMWISKRKYAAVPWPRLLFIATENGLKVFSIKKTRNSINMDTKLYHAPLMNIYDHGGLCFGSATHPGDLTLNTISAFEDAVFNSVFTHVNHDKTLRSKDDVSTFENELFWKKNEKVATFNNHWLVDSKLRLKDVV